MLNKKMTAILVSGLMAATMLTACGGSKTTDTASSAASVQAQADSAETPASDISYVDGYYATDANGNDFIIAFYENAPGDVAYVNDGTEEAFAEYTVENAKTDDGQDYLLITVGQTQLGYISDGTDGGAYIVDTDGNVYGAEALSEEEADAIYQALEM